MSKRINVNPDHYKVAGRDRPNEAIPGKKPKSQATAAQGKAALQAQARWDAKKKKSK